MTGTTAPLARDTAPAAPHRDETSENFPVGSRLLPARTRRHVLAFYRFARAADDIADDPVRTSADKIAALDGVLAALEGAAPRTAAERTAVAHRASLAETAVTDAHSRDLLTAFRRDAENPRCADWDDLMGYCRLSAASVGRFMIDLHGEDRAAYPASDALCAALQVLNHLQDGAEDLRGLDRVYVPLDWLTADGATIDDLRRPALTPGLRRTIDRCLDASDALIAEGRALPGRLGRSRLRWEASVIVVVAERLSRKLRRGDPLAGRVALGKAERLGCLLAGLLRAWRPT